jgi:hypothetical protein
MNIKDVIHHRNKYGTQEFVVIDRTPDFLYEKEGDYLIGEDSGLFNFYKHIPPSNGFEAFAGRKFDINLKNGDVVKASGQWWDARPDSYDDLVYKMGVSSLCELDECHVFFSRYIDKKMVDDWIEDNEPSNNYHKYDKRHSDYGKNQIVSKWES